MAEKTNSYCMMRGYCPDEACKTQLFFSKYDPSVECSSCGQRHQQQALHNISEVTNPDLALEKILHSIFFGNKKAKKGPESVKVLGFSNYECKILSPFLTRYGMEKNSGKAQLLSEMGQPAIFDCGVLGGHAFLIDPDQMEVSGYGRDHSGSMTYLRETLDAVRKSNNDEETLLPIHADGDGHCLVHAVSRALMGRELFWHPLRANLKEHFQNNIEKYKQLFRDFIDSEEWNDIIAECDPDFEPRDNEPMGLRNIHIFGLANILRRPIILLDSITGMQSSGDYTGVFLPGLVPPEMCRGKDGVLNKPLCLAWSSNGHNHYIALVGVKGRPLPIIPGWMVPKTWGIPQSQLTMYLELQDDMGCVIGGSKCLGDGYIQRLVHAMETVFKEQYKVSASLVADYKQYIYRSTGHVRMRPSVVVREAACAVRESRLYRCFVCHGLSVFKILPEWLLPEGRLYQLAVSSHGSLETSKVYSFPIDGVVCTYNKEEDCLVPDISRCRLTKCALCMESKLRLVRADGSVVYLNGDRTQTPTKASRCNCGFKHYWDELEYDNIPAMFPVQLEWGGKTIVEKVVWFEHESDPALNSNVYKIAQQLVLKHFPGEFGSETLVQKVVSRILEVTASATADVKDGDGHVSHNAANDKEEQYPEAPSWDGMTASKIILTGSSKKALHKEELTKSKVEREVRQRIETKACQAQRRRTMEDSQRPATTPSPTKVNPKQQKTTANSVEQPTVQPSPPPATNGLVEKMVQRQRQIRVSTSDGRQTQLTLAPVTTYDGLQQQLASHLHVSPERQRIKVGFPPRELLPPADGQLHDASLDLNHGDRVMLEILPDPSAAPDYHEIEPLPMPTNATDQLLQSMAALQSDSASDIERSVTALVLIAQLTGPDLWAQVQGMPFLFARGGLFYEQVNRDLKLTPNKHCILPHLPDKIFRYNATEDILELCLEPHGHYRVEKGIEERILGAPAGSLSPAALSDLGQHLGVGASQAKLRAALRSGSHGIQVDPVMNRPAMPLPVPFSGEGHSMSGHGHSGPLPLAPPMPTGQPVTTPASQPDQLLAPSGGRKPPQPQQQQQQCKAVPMETSDHVAHVERPVGEDCVFRRVGPGYRILQPRRPLEPGAPLDTLSSVAASLGMAPGARADGMPEGKVPDSMSGGMPGSTPGGIQGSTPGGIAGLPHPESAALSQSLKHGVSQGEEPTEPAPC